MVRYIKISDRLVHTAMFREYVLKKSLGYLENCGNLTIPREAKHDKKGPKSHFEKMAVKGEFRCFI